MDPLQLLIQNGELSQDRIAQVQSLMETDNLSMEAALIAAEIPKQKIRQAFAEYFQVPAYELKEGWTLDDTLLRYIPEESATHYRIMPVGVEDGVLLVGASNPDDIQVREVLNFISTKYDIGYKFVFMLEEDIRTAQQEYSNLKGDVTDALGTLEGDLDKKVSVNSAEAEEEALGNTSESKNSDHIEEDAPVTKIVATILRYAVDGRASDIHIEPTEAKVVVRFRVDGELATSLELPKNVQMAVVARVKILSSMRLDERRKPQDGRFSANFDGRKIDFRVSLLPTTFGEKVVMRILDNDRGVRTLEDIGASPHILQSIRRAIKEPYGIILISGPTGSGKSTTLYSMLSEVDRLTNNVLSLEDPVEYKIEGVSQSQVRPEIGYTFAQGLRAALRQDPDIIMVGEIRDKETAQLAIQAALTGHLVFSTIHTNNSIGVVPRLIDMGVDPYLIAPTLKLAVAQRLARRLYPGTGIEVPLTDSTKLMIDDTFKSLPHKYHDRIPKSTTLINPEPSPACSTGMKGRVAVMEALEITEEIQNLILKNAPEDELFKAARKNGFMTLKEDAIVQALNHTIPYEEMNAFGTKVGFDTIVGDSDLAVDNPKTNDPAPAIININEAITG